MTHYPPSASSANRPDEGLRIYYVPRSITSHGITCAPASRSVDRPPVSTLVAAALRIRTRRVGRTLGPALARRRRSPSLCPGRVGTAQRPWLAALPSRARSGLRGHARDDGHHHGAHIRLQNGLAGLEIPGPFV